MSTPQYVIGQTVIGQNGQTLGQNTPPGRYSKQLDNDTANNIGDVQSKRLPDALSGIVDNGPPPVVERVQQTLAPVVGNIQQTMAPVAENAQNSIASSRAAVAFQEQTAAVARDLEADSHEKARSSSLTGAVLASTGQSAGGVRDIGWHKANADIPDPLIGGLSNGQLFAMIRRFNKDVFAVQSVPPYIARGLDLNEAWSDQYASDKLPLHLQRLYLSIVLGLASFGKQVSRLRSWKETQRTSIFCGAYVVAWLLDLLMPLTLGTLLLVVSSPEARDVLFPPAPRALVNMSTGGLQNPASGQLGTQDSLTGAPEKQEGEAVEEEAANFVSNVRHLVQKAVGMHEADNAEGDPLEGKVPKPIRKGIKAIKAKGTADGHTTETNDQTQEPMEKILWNKANPETLAEVMKYAPHAIGELVDNWERFANAISPTPPFSEYSFIRVAGPILPLFLGSFTISNYMIYKGTGAAIGFAIFGDPILTPALEWLNQNYPNWMELLEPKNNILRGVPTNSQLTLTLLRIGEVHNTPLPPVPTSNPEDADQRPALGPNDIPLEASFGEKAAAVQESPTAHREDEEAKQEPKKSPFSKITRIFKGNTKAAVETKLAVDEVSAKLGSDTAKSHLGVLPKAKNLIYAGPSHFKARYDGKQGWLYITEGTAPVLSYTTKDPRPGKTIEGDLDPILSIDIEGIKTLKRATAFVSKPAEMAADWSSDKDLLGSVEIEDVTGKEWRFTAIPERDELFNRLVAIGPQRWKNL